MKPLILIDAGPAYDRQYIEKYREPAWFNYKTYPTVIAAAGGTPVLPLDEEAAGEYADLADGLLLSGGSVYACRPELKKQCVQEVIPKRMELDRKLFDAFVERKKPVFGICLGIQSINRFLGGTVLYDFKLQDGVEHMWHQHLVDTEPGSVVNRMFGDSFYVNSRHNNRIGRLAEGLKITARSRDGVIEAVEHESLPVYAFEWHPERMRGDIPEPPEGPDMTCLFQWFIEQCRKTKEETL